jgi:hypothetical protein
MLHQMAGRLAVYGVMIVQEMNLYLKIKMEIGITLLEIQL